VIKERRMKKFLLAAAAACLTMVLAGPAVEAAPIVIKVAYENNPGEPVDKVMHYWADMLKEKSKGEITLDLYPSSRLGAKKDVTEQAMMGLNVITITDVGFLTDFDEDLGILFGPYLTDDPQKLFKLYESDWFKKKNEALQKKGVHIVMTNYLYGVRHMLTKKPVNTLADLKGMKIRVPNNTMQIKAIEAMGATPTPMPLGEVYPALTQGLIDGVENPISVLYGQKLHEQAKFLIMNGYLTNTSLWVGGEAFFSKLPAAQLKLIHDTAFDAGLYSQKIVTDLDNEMIGKMKAEGVTVITPDIAPFRAATKAVYTQFPKWTKGLYEQIQAELKK
jgi:TRAP-type transport system periplasmic protein